MTTHPRKRREIIQKHAPWFKLSHYEALKDASPDIWYTQFALRIDLKRARSLLTSPDDPYAEMRRSIHQQLLTILRCKGVLRGKVLDKFLTGEEFLYSEAFSVFRELSAEGVYVREMTWADYSRVETAQRFGRGGRVSPLLSISSQSGSRQTRSASMFIPQCLLLQRHSSPSISVVHER